MVQLGGRTSKSVAECLTADEDRLSQQLADREMRFEWGHAKEPWALRSALLSGANRIYMNCYLARIHLDQRCHVGDAEQKSNV